MAEKKFNDKDFLLDLRGVLLAMKDGLGKELEKRVDRLQNIHKEFEDVIVQAQQWHEQEKEREANKEQKVEDRKQKYSEAEKLAELYGRK